MVKKFDDTFSCFDRIPAYSFTILLLAVYVKQDCIRQGLKYLKMSTTHREGRWRGLRPRARHGGAKRRSAEGVGSGEGRRSPSQYGGLGALPPENFEI